MNEKMILKEKDIEVEFADNFLKRLKGLMFISKEIEKPLLLTPCSRVHSCFMKIPIDIVYLDVEDKIVGKERLEPWKIGKKIDYVKSVLEGRIGFSKDFNLGDKLNLITEGECYVEKDT